MPRKKILPEESETLSEDVIEESGNESPPFEGGADVSTPELGDTGSLEPVDLTAADTTEIMAVELDESEEYAPQTEEINDGGESEQMTEWWPNRMEEPLSEHLTEQPPEQVEDPQSEKEEEQTTEQLEEQPEVPTASDDADNPQEIKRPVNPEAEERRTFYGLDFRELDRDLTPEQRQEWNSIYASYRGRNAMRGTIAGVDRHRLRVKDKATGEMTTKRLYCAIVIPFRVRILIPETEMWAKGEERPGFVLRNIAGANIDFVIIHVDREAGFAVGSRRLALPSRRYFFSTQPDMNSIGSRISCDVLVVGPRQCLVSCNGYDMNLTQREMDYTAIPDLRDKYHSGQSLPCIVKDYDRKGNRLEISVKETVPNPYDGAQFRHPEGSHRQGTIAGKYGGGVFVNIYDGVTVMCSYSFHYDDASFRSGDRVIIVIQRYDDEKKQIYGKIVAKC